MAQSFALAQFFHDGSDGGSIGSYCSHLIPMDRVPPRIVEVMQALNGVVVSDGPTRKHAKLSEELDAFLETCKDCKVQGAVRLPEGATIAVLCQNF